MIMSGHTSSSSHNFDAFRRYNSKTVVTCRKPLSIQQSAVNLNTSSFTSNNSKTCIISSSPFADGIKRFYSVVRPTKIEVDDFKIRRWLSENKRKISISIALLGSGLLITLCFGNMETVPYTNRSHFVLLPPSFEKRMGEVQFEIAKSKKREKILPPSNAESIRVSKILQDIIDESVKSHQIAHLEGLKWEVIVVDEPGIVNAYCLPGGKIVVFTGLLAHFGEDAEIATIISHEVGHVVARHAAEGITLFMWLTIIKLIFNQFYNTSESDKVVNKMSALFLEYPLSRRREMEADYIGLVLMSRAGYDPRVAPMVYEKLGKKLKDSCVLDYTSTHPSGKKRSKLLSQAKVMDESLSIYMGVQAGRGDAAA